MLQELYLDFTCVFYPPGLITWGATLGPIGNTVGRERHHIQCNWKVKGVCVELSLNPDKISKNTLPDMVLIQLD